MRTISPLLCILSLLIVGLTIEASISCLSENGQPVDWWVIAKMPKTKNSSSSFMRDGTGYLYYDQIQGNLTDPNKPITSPQSSPGRTLTQIYNSSRNVVGYAMYNDKSPDGSQTGTLAHSKGVLGYDSTGGFWLIHSVPGYPPFANQSYSYPDSAKVYGQSMLCISLPLSEINTVGKQMQVNGPKFYDYHTPPNLVSRLPYLYAATYGNATISNPPYNIVLLTSSSGREFLSFAKSKVLGKDLYAYLVASFLKQPLLVETWIRGNKACTCSSCYSPCTYVVDNVDYVNFGNGLEYKSTRDHSKWAVTKDKTILCIGDINRMTSQFTRGGGTVCVANPYLANIYYSSVHNISCVNCVGDTDINLDLDVNIEVDILV